MKKNISTENIPIKLWLNDIEDNALAQAKNLANLPFAFKHIALMPDTHEGYGMPIGGVLAAEKVIVPNAVGVDIGCGMCAVKTNLTKIETKTLKHILGDIRKRVPLGFNHHKKKQDISLMPSTENIPEHGIVFREFESALKQIGTLGGGNHFIEIQKGTDGVIWVMIHSGSRNIGLKVAEYYNKTAKKLNERWFSAVSQKVDLAFLPIETKEANNYFSEMRYCVDFALANRKLMLQNTLDIMFEILPEITFSEMINIAHNYACWENHFGKNVIVHRKGATSAKSGETGIIPGSQGTKSYIVQGLGNPESFMSCSHGAGRVMGRNQARRQLNLKEQIDLLDNKGVIHALRHQKDLDEAPAAYKNIGEVMENQNDLVKILVELSPLAVIKG